VLPKFFSTLWTIKIGYETIALSYREGWFILVSARLFRNSQLLKLSNMRIVFILILLFHGLTHYMGFAKAFDFGNLVQISKEISKPMGLFWLLTGLLFITSAILYLMKKETWPILAILAVVLSQILIFMVWKDAKFGTV